MGNYKYKIYCTTDSKWEYTTLPDTDPEPTQCPVNAGHTIDSNSISIDKIIHQIYPIITFVTEQKTSASGSYAKVSEHNLNLDEINMSDNVKLICEALVDTDSTDEITVQLTENGTEITTLTTQSGTKVKIEIDITGLLGTGEKTLALNIKRSAGAGTVYLENAHIHCVVDLP